MRPTAAAQAEVTGANAGAALEAIAAERLRQITSEGWSLEHDTAYHTHGELAMAAACYAMPAAERLLRPSRATPLGWPVGWRWRPDEDRRRELVKAGALIVAELQRLGVT